MKEKDPELTILFITHDVEETLNADDVIVLNNGKLSFQGKPEELFNNKKLVAESGLTLPFGYQIKNLLKEKNIDVKGTSLDDIAEELCISK